MVVFPTSALGYSQTVPVDRDGYPKDISAGGPTYWLLKPGQVPTPTNIRPLFWWLLAAGLSASLHGDRLSGQEVARRERLVKQLHGDIAAGGGWYFTLKHAG